MATLNPIGLTFTANVVAATPGTFGENDWALSGPRDDGFDIVVFAVPTGSAGATTSIQRRINGGSWTSIGGTVAGVYAVTGLSVETAHRVELRAVNAAGASPVSAAKSMFTIPVDPRGFRGWNPTVDLGTTGNVFIAPYGNDTTGSGAVGAPYRTLAKALTVATTGQKIKARAGNYREKVTISTGVTIEGYGTEKPRFTAAEKLTGFVQCTSADAAVIGATLGVDGSPVYKATVSKTGWDYTNVQAMNIYEAGRRVHIPSDRADTSEDMFAPNDSATFWTADSFTVNGSDKITAIVDASVINSSRYTEAQLLACTALIYHFPNVVSAVNITAVNLTTNTITVDGLETSGGYAPKYAIQNSPISLSQGTAFVVDNTTTATVYLYPYDAANLALVEFSPREYVITCAADNIAIRGAVLDRASGTGTHSGANLYSSSSTIDDGCVFSDLLIAANKNPAVATRVLKLYYMTNCVVENCTAWESQASGFFFLGGINVLTEHGSNNLMQLCHFEKIGGTAFLAYAQDDCVFAHNYATRTGLNDHANISNAYQQIDGVVWWGNEFGPECYGYLTWQEATDVVVAFTLLPQLSQTQTTLRAITDQSNNTAPPHASGFGYLFNNTVPPDMTTAYTSGSAISVSTPLSDLTFTMVNNVTHGITDAAHTQVTPAQIGYNIITHLDPSVSQTSGSFDGTNVVQENLSLVYTDATGGDFSPVSGSPILSTEGQDMTSTIATLSARFTQFSGWTKDYKNQTIDWADLPVGADAGLTWVR